MEKSLYTPEYQAFLRLLRTVRREAGLSQVELADRLQITQSMLSKIERGERRLDLGELRQYCRGVNLTLLQFIERLEGEGTVRRLPNSPNPPPGA